MSPSDLNSLGLGVDVQLISKGVVADDAYISRRAWNFAILGECPFHPLGGCGVERLGSYPRVWPKGCRIPRFWCSLAGRSISLLPESLAAGVSGSLDSIEASVEVIEALGISAAVDVVYPANADDAISLESARRSLRRRAGWVYPMLIAVVTLFADRFVGVAPTLRSMRLALGVDRVLVPLRLIVETHLAALQRPFGLCARASA